MSHITLPRAVVEQVREALSDYGRHIFPYTSVRLEAALAALDAALAEPPAICSAQDNEAALAQPEQKPEPNGYAYRYNDGVLRFNDGTQINGARPIEALPYFFAPPAAAKPEPVHPGYIIGSHWLETAYSRIAAGEVEADVLAEVLGARGWVKPEPATHKQMAEAHGEMVGGPWFPDFKRVWRAAERFHGITKEDKT